MNSEQGQLPKTRSSIITEDRGEVLGLPGRLFMLPFFVGIFLMNIPPRSFLLALLAGFISYGILKFYFRGKPGHFLEYWRWEFYAPKRFRHQLDRGSSRGQHG